ncbi:MAG: hypothetical protein NC122_00070 [Faecalibacterium sp.]|nr:hypothetical protein [Ruminococcus sp.]MCM1391375.1 hypothetical protein [Ruminococcus sp.]MCM1484585.1 hypothetical protein [Faecalibacterium sp.]
MHNGVITLKTATKKIMSILLCILMLSLTLTPAYAAVTYPAGVTEQSAEKSAGKTDILIANAVDALEKKTLSQLVYPMLFSNETVSGILTSVYGSLAENADSLDRLGIDISTKAVAEGLSAYPAVSQRVAAAADWNSVDLDGVDWGITTKQQFADALAAMLNSFNDVLYMVLCSGTYSAGIINLKGDDGYGNGVVSMLTALGCTSITDAAEYKTQADANKNTMISNIVMSVFSMLDSILEAPATRLSQIMPNLAHYLKNGGFQDSVNALMSPLTLGIGKYISLFSGSTMLTLLMFLQDPSKYTINFSENMTTILNDAMASSELQLAEIDLDAIAACGTLNGDTVVANVGESYTVIFRWLIDTLKLNKDKLKEMMKQENTASSTEEQSIDINKVIDSLLAKSTDEIFAMLVELLTAESGTELDYQWQTPQFTKTQVSYTANLGQEKYQRVLDGIDDLLNQFIAENDKNSTLQSTLKEAIYSPTLISTLVTSIYGALGDGEMGQMVSMLGLPATPSQLAAVLTGSQFSSARYTLSRYSNWKNVNANSLYWGFTTGDAKGFKNALVAVLSPFAPMLRMLLAADRIEILGAIGFCGSNGYNTAIIPLLEAIGCPSDDILTYEQFKAQAGEDGVIENLLTPILSLVNKVIDKPIYTLTEILPNIIFFVQNGSMIQCIENLIKPLTDMLDKLSISIADFGIDFAELKSKDLLAEITEKLPELTDEINLGKPNLAALAGIGELTTVESKRTYNGVAAQVSYVKADQTAVLMTILRYFVGLLKDPANESLMGGMMGGFGDNDMFAQASGGIGDEMANMSTDETIEWLYKLLFRERAVSTTVAYDSDYSTEIVYQPKEESNTKQIVIPIIVILVVIAAFLIIRRKRIKVLLENRKLKKSIDTSAKSQQEV